MAVTVDRDSLRRGIATYLAIAVPSGIVYTLADGSGSTGAALVLFVAALLIFAVAPVVAGGRAGQDQPSPYVHGALTVALPGGAYLMIWLAFRLARGDVSAADVITFLLFFVIEIGLGMLGGYFGFRRHHRPTRA